MDARRLEAIAHEDRSVGSRRNPEWIFKAGMHAGSRENDDSCLPAGFQFPDAGPCVPPPEQDGSGNDTERSGPQNRAGRLRLLPVL